MSETTDELAAVRKLRVENARLTTEVNTLKAAGGGGTSGGVTDDWKASVDAQLKQLHEDFRKLLTWLIAGVVAPLLAIIGLYGYTDNKADRLADRLSELQVSQARADGTSAVLSQRVTDVDKKLDQISAKLDRR